MFYVGLTTHLGQILKKHKEKKMHSFDGNLEFNRLVHAEQTNDIQNAIARLEELRSAPYYQKQQLVKSLEVEELLEEL